jgi:RimJ/RimL family protein N-acetyltransferase
MEEFTNPPMRGRHVFLRPVRSEDYRFIEAAQASEAMTVRWRFRGSTPAPDTAIQSMWHNVLAQFLIVSTVSDRPIGLVAAYRPNFQDGHAHIAAARFEGRRSPLMVLGHTLFLNYVFTCWNFHKLYMAIPEYNYPQIRSGLNRYFQLEGRLREHYYYGGHRWDELLLAIYREQWRARARDRLSVELEGDALPTATRQTVTLTIPPHSEERLTKTW